MVVVDINLYLVRVTGNFITFSNEFNKINDT